jgi:Zn-dependent protease
MNLNPGATCQRCLRPLAPGALSCDNCHALVHAGEMERLAAQARALEAQGRMLEAHTRWMSILPLLPPESKQAQWIREHVRELQSAPPPPSAQGGPPKKSRVAKWLGPLAPVAILLAKFKGVLLALFKLKFLFSFASFIGVYWAMWGPKFGIGFAVLILVHEMGHYIDIKRRGLPADMPVFFPGLGAYVRWQAMGVSLETRAAIALAGPLAGCLGAAVCGVIWYETHDGIWAALARTTALLNALNLTPVWIFDGAQAVRALRKTECALLVLVSAGLGYATKQWVFAPVAVGAVWQLAKGMVLSRSQVPATQGLGLDPGPADPTAPVPSEPQDLLGRHESHGIAAYYLAVLAALAMILWLMPAAVGER